MVVRLLSRSALRRQAGSEIVVVVLLETRHRGADVLQVLRAFLKLRPVVRVAFWRQRAKSPKGSNCREHQPPRTRSIQVQAEAHRVFKVKGELD